MILHTEIENLDIQDDFDQFINVVLEKPFKLTSKGTLPPKECWEIDRLMVLKNLYPNPKSSFKEYPLLVLFVEISLKAKMLRIEKQKGGLFFVADQENLHYYLTFNKIEKYFFLLYFFINDCDYAAIAGGNNRGDRFTPSNMDTQIWEIAKKKAGTFASIYEYDMKFLIPYFSYFGFLEVEYESDRKFYSRKQKVTKLGKELCTILFEKRKTMFWNKKAQRFPALIDNFFDTDVLAEQYTYAVTKKGKRKVLDLMLIAATEIKKAQEERFIDAFVSYLPPDILTKTIEYKLNLQPVIGNYIFKVSVHSKIWRRIAISGENTLEDLHLAIQDAFEFGNDHLYAFYLDGNPYSEYAYEDPRGEQGLDASEAVIKDLYLDIEQKIFYIFDFGDNWEFEVVLEEIQKEATLLTNYEIIETKGEAPKQYEYDNEYEEEE